MSHAINAQQNLFELNKIKYLTKKNYKIHRTKNFRTLQLEVLPELLKKSYK